MKGLGLRATVPSGHPEEYLIRIVVVFGGLDYNIPVLVVVETTRVNDLIFLVFLATSRIFVSQVIVGKFALRVLVQEFHVGVLKTCELDTNFDSKRGVNVQSTSSSHGQQINSRPIGDM